MSSACFDGPLPAAALRILDEIDAEWSPVDEEIWGQPGRTRARIEHYIRFGPDRSPADLTRTRILQTHNQRPLPSDADRDAILRWEAARAAFDDTSERFG